MTKFFALLFCVTGCLLAQPKTLDLGERGRVTLYLVEGWSVDHSTLNGSSTYTISPNNDANASCTIAVTFPETDRFDTKARLKLRVEADGHGLAERSVEGKAIAKELTLTSGYGFICNFTDPEMRGRPSQKGNYKVLSVGRIRLNAEVLLEIAIMADDFKGEHYQQLLGAIEGMEFRPGAGR